MAAFGVRKHQRTRRKPAAGTGKGRAHQVGNPATDPLATIGYWRERLSDPLFVYFIQSGDSGPVKIGQANDPAKRMAHLQCGNPLPLRLRAVVLAGVDLESDLHGLWRNACVGGEWFGGGHEDFIINNALRAMAQQIGTPQNDLYEASSTLVTTCVSPMRYAA